MEWELEAPDGSCSVCGRPFEQSEEYWSAIFSAGQKAGEGEGSLSRRDYCAACWRAPLEGAFSFWRTRCRLQPPPPKRFVNDEVLIEFFERLREAGDGGRRKLLFIMAVLLLRKRLLKEKARRRDESGMFWVLSCPSTGKEFEVRDEGLAEDEIADVLHEISQVLNIRIRDSEAAGEGAQGP